MAIPRIFQQVNSFQSAILLPTLLLIIIVPDGWCQYYYYHNGYYYPQQQNFQFEDQSWQFQQHQQQFLQFSPAPSPPPQFAAPPPPQFAAPPPPQFAAPPPPQFAAPPPPQFAAPPPPQFAAPPPPQFAAPPPPQFAAPPPPQIAAPPPPQFVEPQQTLVQAAPPQPIAFQEITPPPLPPLHSMPQKKIESEARFEFDLPPPPPAMFLPDEKDKVRIAQFLAQRRNRRPKQPANRHLVQHQLQAQRNLLESQQKAQRVAAIQPTIPPQPVVEQIRPFPAPPAASIPEPQSSLAQLSHLEPKFSDPNKVFLSCCKNKRVDKVCESRCNFDTLNKKVLTQMFIGTDPCPQNFGLDLFSCAAQDSDHTPCCLGKKVERTSAGKKCLAFCKMTPDSHFQADASYLPCWSVLNNVKACFKEAILEKKIS